MANDKSVKVSADKHFVEHNGTSIEIPKPIDQMTQNDWIRMATGKKNPLQKVTIENQSFLGLHVVLKDKNYIPIWLYSGSRSGEVPRAFDTLERAVNMGCQLISTLDDIQEPYNNRFSLGADGHIHRDDVVLAKIPIVAYYALQAQNIQKSKAAIEYQSQESKAYEGLQDMPHYVKGNKEVSVFETQEHTVRYADRPGQL